jgi:hypothetical protein
MGVFPLYQAKTSLPVTQNKTALYFIPREKKPLTPHKGFLVVLISIDLILEVFTRKARRQKVSVWYTGIHRPISSLGLELIHLLRKKRT